MNSFFILGRYNTKIKVLVILFNGHVKKAKLIVCVLFKTKLFFIFVFFLVTESWAIPICEDTLTLVNTPYTLVIRKTAHQTEKAGDILAVSMPLSVMLFTAAYETGTEGLSNFTLAFILSQAEVAGLKAIVHKRRPNGVCCNSFPSGHASSAFVAAAFVHARYQSMWSIPMYLLAGYVGYSRFYADKHYREDVAAGALIGVANAFLVTKAYNVESTGHLFEKNWRVSWNTIQRHTAVRVSALF